VGPFRLTSLLRPLLAAGDYPRIITMASGGLYGQGISMSDLQTTKDYTGTRAYARAKRAQLLLNGLWATELSGDNISVYTMHPGWADTPGVADALPGFGKLLGPLLRSAEEGADTLAWLATEPTSELGNGGFWLDRRRRPEHRLPTTKSADQKADALWNEIARLAGVDFD
jgi:dehydrogenase/reductase SDR family protein 12